MISSVLVPLDGSPFAEQALPLGATVARACRAKLRLVMVHEPPPPPLAADQASTYLAVDLKLRHAEQVYLKRQAARARVEGKLTVVTAVLDDPVPEAIAEHVRIADVGLVVMTTHGRGTLSRLVLGSVAHELIRTVTVPVLLLRPREEAAEPLPPLAPGRRILVPLDGSSEGEAALEPAADLAGRLRLGLTLVQVIEPTPLVGDGLADIALPETVAVLELEREASEQYLARTAEPLRARGLRVNTAVEIHVSVTEALVELAHAPDVVMVALSTQGRGGLERLLLGSVADKLVRAAERPVLVRRPAERAQPRRTSAAGRRARPRTRSG